MKRIIVCTIFILALQNVNAQPYPAAKTVDSADTWHGITVKDPYRWIEDLKSDETKNWFKAQSDYTDNIINKLPLTNELYNGLLMMDSVQPDKVAKVRQVGNALFYFNIKLGEAKAKIYKRNGEKGKEELLADNTMWGSNYTISDYEIDPYQQYIAITAAEGGKEISVVKFYSIAQNKFLKDSIPGYFAGFAPGAGNVFYMQQPTWDVHVSVPEKDKLFKTHHLGTDTLQDKIYLSYATNPELYTPDNSKRIWPVWLDKDFNYEFIQQSSVSPYIDIYYRKINSGNQWKKMIDAGDNVTSVYGFKNKLVFISNKNAPNSKIMVLDMNEPNMAKATVVVPEKETTLEGEIGRAHV